MASVSPRHAAYAAMALSSLAIVLCIAYAPLLVQRIGAVTESVELNMADFRQKRQDIWAEVRHSARLAAPLRKKRQAGQCGE